MGSKSRRKRSLHDLSRLPLDVDTFFKELEGESDRATALIAGAVVSEGFVRIIEGSCRQVT